MLFSQMRSQGKVHTGRLSRWLTNNCSGKWSYRINMFCFGLAWLIFPIENRFYQKIVKNRTYYFPQIDFHNLRPLDPIRGLVQLSFLMFVAGSKEDAAKRLSHSTYASRFFLFRWVNHIFKRINRGTRMIAERVSKKLASEGKEKTGQHKPQQQKLSLFKKIFVGFLLAIGFVLYVLCITQPFSLEEQVIFLLILGVIALTLFQAQTRFTLLMLIVISVIVSSRYVWWRYSETLNPNSYTSVIFTWLLIIAETYAFIVMLLGYFQVCWVLDRKPASLPKDKERWPSVDIFIPTYNEPLDVVKPTVYAALTVDWPKEKLNVYILDDGSRKEFKDFACEVGADYIEREEHKHAKAGNINHAMGITKGDFIAIFDCDHVPVKTFLQKTMGWFLKDEKIALVQTPHHFYSQDPFEKNLHLKENVPNENSLFHDFIQKGNDTWNATMFCGSCAIMRRKALEEVGGIAVETVTEDAHTSLKLNRRGCPAIPYAAVLDNHVGYINLSTFSGNPSKEFKKAFLDLKTQGATSLVIDLRGNGGGLLDEAVEIANYFLPRGKVIVTTKGKIKQASNTYKTLREPLDLDIPVAVLVNSGTASASEILSGSLQDLDRAIVVGNRTFGKGLVQVPRSLPYGGTMKVTTSKYYIPSGRCVQAIDYKHRNEDGSVGTIPDSLTKVFHTAAGREVRDGGGVMPDIVIKQEKLPNILFYLVRDNLIFDYATQYCLKHPTIVAPDKLEVTDADYNDFKALVKKADFKYDQQSEKILKTLKEAAEFEGYMADASEEFKALEKKLNHDLDRDLDYFSGDIKKMIASEIIKRYYYQRGNIIQQLKDDDGLKEAVKILNDPVKYKEMLSAPVAKK